MTSAKAGYVLAVAVLTAFATSDPDHLTVWAWVAVLLLTVPAIIVTLPLLYVLVPIGWALTDHFHVAWPTTCAYVLSLSVAATVNAVLFSALRKRRGGRRLRQGSSEELPGPY